MNVLGVAIIAIIPFWGLMAIYVIPMIVAGLMAVVCLMYFIKKPDKRNVKMNLTDVAVLLFAPDLSIANGRHMPLWGCQRS